MRASWAILVAALVVFAGCASTEPPGGNGPGGNGTDDGPDATDGTPPHPTDGSDGPDLQPPDGAAVLATAADLVTHPNGTDWFRVPGTEGNLEQARHLRDRLVDRGFDARLQHFNATLPLTGPTWCRNVVGHLDGELDRDLVLAAHFDSRLLADKDPDPDRRDERVLGANDGASGVAVVLHVIDALPELRHGLTVYFFDCEDQGDHSGGWAVGSEHAADQLSESEAASIDAFVLFDLVGDRNLSIPREGYSATYAPWLVDAAMGLAERNGLTAFENRTGGGITDDHVPFLLRGIPALDLIHLDQSPDGDPFPDTHHTSFDDVEHLSADSLGQVAELGLRLTVHLDRRGA